MAKDLMGLVNAYLEEGRLLHLATGGRHGLWMSHVWYAIGPSPNTLVFTSNRSRRHSLELEVDRTIAGGVVAIKLEGLGQKVRGLSFEGRAHEAVGSDVSVAYDAYARRWPQVRGMFAPSDMVNGTSAMRMYIVEMTRIVFFDEQNFPDDPRQEIIVG